MNFGYWEELLRLVLLPMIDVLEAQKKETGDEED